ncbi:MAG: hypothetical protein EXS10_00040 [Phycisphaerales bacterium]|nr:hypothetical protein [Phycisphaerales bacterium]
MSAGYFLGASQREANAGPPEPSNGGGSSRSSTEPPGSATAALDPALQRAQLSNEMRALRAEVAALRDTMTSGRMKVEVTNLKDLGIEEALQAALRTTSKP